MFGFKEAHMKKATKIVLLVSGSVVLLTAGGLVFAGCKNSTLEQIVRTFDLTEKEVQNFNFDLSTSNVEFIPTTDGTKKVMLYENERHWHEEKVEDKTLYVVSKSSEKWYEKIGWDLTEKKVEIYYPSTEFASLRIDSSTGNVKIPNEFSFNTCEIDLSTGNIAYNANTKGSVLIESSTGDISLSDVNAASMRIKRSTGKASLINVNVEDLLVLEGSTGRTELEKTRSKTIDISGSTGTVKLNDIVATEKIKVKVSTGDVKFSDVDAGTEIDIETSTGDVEGSLLSGKTFDLRSDTGRIDAPPSTIGAPLCKVKTDTGDIKITVKA